MENRHTVTTTQQRPQKKSFRTLEIGCCAFQKDRKWESVTQLHDALLGGHKPHSRLSNTPGWGSPGHGGGFGDTTWPRPRHRNRELPLETNTTERKPVKNSASHQKGLQEAEPVCRVQSDKHQACSTEKYEYLICLLSNLCHSCCAPM